MHELAEKILECLPEDGSKVSGGQIKDQLKPSTKDFKEAKAFLKEHGLVSLGRGRGGTLARIEGGEMPEKVKKLSQGEKMALAREAKIANKREREKSDKMRTAILAYCEPQFPDADEIVPLLKDYGVFYIEVWKEGKADMYKGYEEDLET